MKYFLSIGSNIDAEKNLDFAYKELKNILKVALKSLNQREALVTQLYYVEELNVYEIAEVLEISTGRVSQIKTSAIKRIREQLKKAN